MPPRSLSIAMMMALLKQGASENEEFVRASHKSRSSLNLDPMVENLSSLMKPLLRAAAGSTVCRAV